MQQKKVVIVDDAVSYAETLGEFASRCGYEIVIVDATAKSVEDVLAAVQASGADAAMVDLQWGNNTNGLGCVRRLTIPALLMSARREPPTGFEGAFASKFDGMDVVVSMLGQLLEQVS